MKPRPFFRSFGGLALIVVLTIILLGVNNYRTYYFGFELPYTRIACTLTDAKQAGTTQLITNQDTFQKLCDKTTNPNINWEKQVVVAYFGEKNGPSQLAVESLKRQSTDINIKYTRPAQIAPYVPTPAEKNLLLAVDRSKLIASSPLTVKFITDTTTTGFLTISPAQL